jgi:hypothetical protein
VHATIAAVTAKRILIAGGPCNLQAHHFTYWGRSPSVIRHVRVAEGAEKVNVRFGSKADIHSSPVAPTLPIGLRGSGRIRDRKFSELELLNWGAPRQSLMF